MTGTAVHIPTLATARLVLRAHRLADFDAYVETLASERARWMDRLDRRDAWFAFANDVAGWQLHGYGGLAVDLYDGTHVALCGIQRPAHFPEPELGWILHAGHEGRGYATEAARAVLDWARGRVASLVSYVTPGNDRSAAVARRLGARLDGAAPLPDGETPAETVVFRHWGAPA
ncbi:GNAT family N-acetyltransferase [Jannaschia sp. W003]|uniref:GNAT family N-acetyltransferase n=1 Tax=Jannaschia sp. W003 TaxID=2867012 RepID=UPI0021A47157|nr:GNAT family N-acetyltransferase [Jannaschia sp. W003]UWQ22223.1 GNAT family N-acetyltransferase [Jannaschia sp. W003]